MAHDLFEAAREAMAKAYAPYSKFPVGAAIRAEDGKVYVGANIENLSFPQGACRLSQGETFSGMDAG